MHAFSQLLIRSNYIWADLLGFYCYKKAFSAALNRTCSPVLAVSARIQFDDSLHSVPRTVSVQDLCTTVCPVLCCPVKPVWMWLFACVFVHVWQCYVWARVDGRHILPNNLHLEYSLFWSLAAWSPPENIHSACTGIQDTQQSVCSLNLFSRFSIGYSLAAVFCLKVYMSIRHY